METSRVRNIGVLLLTITTGWTLSGCSDNSDGPPAQPVKNLTITTYNAGLAPNFVRYTNERLPANEDLLADYDADVICFQEVWLDEQVDAIKAAVSEELPHSYSVPPEQVFTDEPACTEEEVEGLANCALELCPGASGADLIACAPVQCGAFFLDLSPTCNDGVIASVGIPDVTVEKLVENVTQPTGKFSYDGALGLILASRYPLRNREFQDLIEDSTAVHRGALYADIEVDGESVLLGCTHAQANLSASVDYPPSGKYGSWEGENLFMQEQFASFANDKAQGRPILFGGDFNCSIPNASNGVDGDFAGGCRVWLDDGFADPAAEQLPCTFCNDENLVLLLDEASGNFLLDHVFVKNLPATATLRADRVFDDPVSIEATIPPSELQPEDSPIMMHPSDHYGVELSISWQ